MKYLNQFLKFDSDLFFGGKKFLLVGKDIWREHDESIKNVEDRKKLGTKAEIVVIEDKTSYKRPEGSTTTNVYEKFFVKVDGDINIEVNTPVTIENVECKVWGDYGNNLSVTGTVNSIRPVNQNPSK